MRAPGPRKRRVSCGAAHRRSDRSRLEDDRRHGRPPSRGGDRDRLARAHRPALDAARKRLERRRPPHRAADVRDPPRPRQRRRLNAVARGPVRIAVATAQTDHDAQEAAEGGFRAVRRSESGRVSGRDAARALRARHQADLIVGTSAGALNGAYIASRPQASATAETLGLIWRELHRSQVFRSTR